MKVCPKCGSGYGDELSFCLEDGTPLQVRMTTDIANLPTEAYNLATNPLDDISRAETIVSHPNPLTPPPKQYQMSVMNPANKMGCAVTVGQVATLFLVVLGLGGALLYFVLNQSRSELALSSSSANKVASKPAEPAANAVANSAGNSAANTSAPPKPQATVPGDPKTISGGVLNGKATSLPKPAYPPAAKAVRASGSVSVQVLVDETGKVVSANAVSGHPLLRAAAAAAAREARFEPTLLSGKPVKVSGVITYNFVP